MKQTKVRSARFSKVFFGPLIVIVSLCVPACSNVHSKSPDTVTVEHSCVSEPASDAPSGTNVIVVSTTPELQSCPQPDESYFELFRQHLEQVTQLIAQQDDDGEKDGESSDEIPPTQPAGTTSAELPNLTQLYLFTLQSTLTPESQELKNDDQPPPPEEGGGSTRDQGPTGTEVSNGDSSGSDDSPGTSENDDQDNKTPNHNLELGGFLAFISLTVFCIYFLARELLQGQTPEITSVFTHFGGDISGWGINAAMLWLAGTIVFTSLALVVFVVAYL